VAIVVVRVLIYSIPMNRTTRFKTILVKVTPKMALEHQQVFLHEHPLTTLRSEELDHRQGSVRMIGGRCGRRFREGRGRQLPGTLSFFACFCWAMIIMIENTIDSRAGSRLEAS
jgi:hypothetical protein